MNIVIVDDSEIERELLGHIFSDLKESSVAVFESADDALDYIMSDTVTHIDAVISDWNMPCMSGFDLLEACRMLYPRLPFFMVSSNTDASAVKKAKLAGATGYISKPYKSSTILGKIRNIAA